MSIVSAARPQSVAVEARLTLPQFGLLLLVVATWGIAFTGMKLALHDGPPLQTAGLRFFFGALPLLPFALAPRRRHALTPRLLAQMAVLGFFQTTVMFGIVFLALRFIPAGLTSIIMNTNPFYVAIMAHFLIVGDRFSRIKSIGLVLGFGGVAVIIFGGKGIGGDVPLVWVALLFVAAFSWAISSVLVKLFRFNDMTSVSAWQSLIGSLPLLVVGFLTEAPIHWTWGYAGWTVFLALGATTFGWLAWYSLLRRYTASRVTVYLFLIPVFGVLSAALILGEPIGLNLLFGGGLVVAGIVLVNRRTRVPETAD